ncbi:MAG: hypothetical protein COC01_06015 [Bacteroidetes bacterium]|nr:MAG: hypothetical protein COC01_06015 [Bacteroidota bacterium]
MSEVLELDYIKLELEIQQVISTEDAWQYRIVPKKNSAKIIEFYIDQNHGRNNIKEELEIYLNKEIELFPASSDCIEKTLSRYYLRKKRSDSVSSSITNNSGNFVANLLDEAQSLGSSDIHVEALEKSGRVRMRIDGMLVERYTIGDTEYPSFINKIKIMSNLDIAEKRLPQDNSGTPVLSRIPVLKWIFSSKTKSKRDTKLNIFIKPTIVY